MKRGYLLLILVILSCNLVLANGYIASGKVAYVTKSGKVDQGFANAFIEMGLSIDLIKPKEIYTTDFSKYNFIFIGDERIRNAGDIPVDLFPSVIANKYHGEEFELTNAGGVSQLGSNTALDVKADYEVVQVYTKSTYKTGGLSIPYYYLNPTYENPIMQTVATTNVGYDVELGDVIAYSADNQGPNKCFFGIIKTKFWTEETKEMFKDCVGFAMQGSPIYFVHDVAIDETYTNSVNGVRIKDVATGEYLLGSVSQLECDKEYKIDFKTLNNGDFSEDIDFLGVIDGFNWTSKKTGLGPGESTTTGSKTLTIDFDPGFYTIDIFAEIIDDANPLDNSASRDIEVICSPVIIEPFCGDNICNAEETCETCQGDCGVCEPVCGDYECNGDETCSTCEMDCGVCEPICGNEVVEYGEECDDGNLINGDGCNDYCIVEAMIHDVGIIGDYTNSVNGIRIKNVLTGEYLLDTVSRLECNKSYKIDYKTMNLGNYVEDVDFLGIVNGYNWTSSKENLTVGGYTTAGSKTLTIDFDPGFYAINIFAEIMDDANPLDNSASRDIEVFCVEPVDVCGELCSGEECSLCG
ncbi:MAG: DUF4215 domain-containing protein [archaeon]